MLNFAPLVPCVQVAFLSEPSRNLLCVTVLDINLTRYAYMLSLRRTRSPQRKDARGLARAAAGPSTF